MVVYVSYSRKSFLRKGSSPPPFPKTFNLNFPPDRAHDNKKAHVVITWVAPYPGENLKLKVLGREFEGDSPQCGEMSRSDRGDRRRQRNPFSKGSPSISNV